LICHDVEFPQLSTRLARQSVDVLLVPSMTSDRYGEQRVHSCAQARTVEHQCFAVVSAIVPAVGTRSEYAGRAAVYAPRTPYFELDGTHGDADAPAIVVADLDLKLLQRSRKDPNTIYPARDTR
jgi:predicted amidohydrolase